MAENSKIQWCDHTFNPWIGCTKVSPACDHCYAEHLMDHRLHQVSWGYGKPRRRTSEQNWLKPLVWNRRAERLGIRYRVFCASLADVFDTEVPGIWRRDLFELIEATPELDWLLLTKRPEAARRHFNAHDWPENIWIGATAENQKMLDLRWPVIAGIPRIRFLSCEPLLSPISLLDYEDQPPDWVIAGGESGPNARPMDPRWAMLLKGDADYVGSKFFMKQMSGTSKRQLNDIPPELALRELPA